MGTNNAESQHNPGPEHIPKHTPIYIQMSPLSLHFSNCWNKLQHINTIQKPSPTTRLKFNLQLPIPIGLSPKALAEKQTEFHTYKPKEERSYRVVLKNMHYSIAPVDIKTEIEKLGHQVTNIWNITQYRTKLKLSMFYVELKPASNNIDIFLVEYLQQCEIKFEPPKHKREIDQCAN
jgi:hypothetical protein